MSLVEELQTQILQFGLDYDNMSYNTKEMVVTKIQTLIIVLTDITIGKEKIKKVIRNYGLQVAVKAVLNASVYMDATSNFPFSCILRECNKLVIDSRLDDVKIVKNPYKIKTPPRYIHEFTKLDSRDCVIIKKRGRPSGSGNYKQ